jgi:hypothetical protein
LDGGGVTGGWFVTGGELLLPPPPPPQAVSSAAASKAGNFRFKLSNEYMLGSFMRRFYANFKQDVFLLRFAGRGKIAIPF